jgi:hypothetical protein
VELEKFSASLPSLRKKIMSSAVKVQSYLTAWLVSTYTGLNMIEWPDLVVEPGHVVAALGTLCQYNH